MSELTQILLTAALTLLGGTLLVVIGELIKVLVILPLQKYKEQVQQTLDRLDFYANQITNFFSEKPSEEEMKLIRQVSTDFRSAATQLNSKYSVISARGFLIKLKIIPSAKEIKDVYGSLIFISNNMPRAGNELNKELDPITLNHKHTETVKNILTKGQANPE